MAQQQTLAAYIQREREEVQKAREDLLAKRREIDEQLKGLDRRWEAAEAYEAVLRGKPIPQPRAPRAPRAPRGKRGERRAELVDLIRQHPDGLTADQINQFLNATDKKDKQVIANLLANMKKEGTLHQEQRRGPYVIPADKAA
jgi:hypothetical protein